MLNTQYNPQNRIDNALDVIAQAIGSEDSVKGVYPLPLKKIADTVEGIAAKINEDGGLYAKVPMHICGSDDYDHETGEPTIDNPEENVFYLVPTGEDSDDMFEEWVYTNGKWEHFGAGGSVQVPQSDWGQTNTSATDYIKNKPTIPAAQIQSDWNQTTTSSKDYIKNKPAIKVGTGTSSILEAFAAVANGNYSHAEGNGTQARGIASHAEGQNTSASGYYSHAEGVETTASGAQSHAEGGGTTASGIQSHAEGGGTTASGYYSHAEGVETTASGAQSHAEGGGTTASGLQSHAEGVETTASGSNSHAEGRSTTASGAQSHAEGQGTTANHLAQHVFGRYNIADDSTAVATSIGNYVEIVGNGTKASALSNARTLDWSGNEWLAGNMTAAGGSITIGSTTITEAQLQALLASLS